MSDPLLEASSFFFLSPFDWALACDGQRENTRTGLLSTPLLSAHYLDLQVISGAATSAMTSLTNVATSAPLYGLYHSSCVIKQPADTSRECCLYLISRRARTLAGRHRARLGMRRGDTAASGS